MLNTVRTLLNLTLTIALMNVGSLYTMQKDGQQWSNRNGLYAPYGYEEMGHQELLQSAYFDVREIETIVKQEDNSRLHYQVRFKVSSDFVEASYYKNEPRPRQYSVRIITPNIDFPDIRQLPNNLFFVVQKLYENRQADNV